MVLMTVSGLLAQGELSGRRAPGFSLVDMSLKQHDLADYRGKIVLLDIMKTGCPDCQTLSQTLEKVKAAYKDKVVVLTVVNPPETQTTVAQYVAKYKVTGPVLFDCGQMAASYMMATPQKPTIHLPHLFLIDGEGMIRNDFGSGPKSKDIFEGRGLFKVIDRLLAEQTPPKKR